MIECAISFASISIVLMWKQCENVPKNHADDYNVPYAMEMLKIVQKLNFLIGCSTLHSPTITHFWWRICRAIRWALLYKFLVLVYTCSTGTCTTSSVVRLLNGSKLRKPATDDSPMFSLRAGKSIYYGSHMLTQRDHCSVQTLMITTSGDRKHTNLMVKRNYDVL